jgi:hypothetical protein
MVALALGALGIYSLGAELAAVGVATALLAAISRFRFAWPFAKASRLETAGFVLVVGAAALAFLGHPFEMLLGERDATVYTVSGIGLAREGSLVLHDHAVNKIDVEAMRRFYPSAGRAEESQSSFLHLPRCVKYPGFYFVDRDRREIIAQGLPLLPALIAIFYGAFGLGGAFAANNFIGVVAVMAVFGAAVPLIGEAASTLGALLLALDAIEVWAARYPVAEMLFQMLLFAGFAAFLRGDRFGRRLAGFFLGVTLFAKIEAALLLAPIGIYGLIAFARRRALPGPAFWWTFGATVSAAAASCLFFQADYAHHAVHKFSRFQSRVFGNFFGWEGALPIAALAAITALALIAFSARSRVGRYGLSRQAARGVAVGVVLFVAFGYWIRPGMIGPVVGQGKTLIWLGWYVGSAVLLLGFSGLAHYLWIRSNAENLFVLSILLTLSAVFLHLTFVNLIQIYMTRRFVPAALPLVLLFFAYLVTEIGSRGVGRTRVLALTVAVAMTVGSVHAIVGRSRHLYRHREYPGLARQFGDLAAGLRDKDLVFLSDRKVRDLLGPALEFAFGLPTLVVWPSSYRNEADRIRGWIDRGTAIAALTAETDLEKLPGTEDFETLDHPVWWLRALGQVYDRFPSEVWEDSLTLSRYAAGPGSDPLYALWQSDGVRVSEAICKDAVQLLGGDRFLLRHVKARCPSAGVDGRTVGYLVGDSQSAVWQKALEVYGARFVRRDLGGVILFDDVAPKADPTMTALSPANWTVEASDGKGAERLALDGRLDTRWGSRVPQRSGMTFTIGFSKPVDLGWVKLRMGRFRTDRARALAFATSVDGMTWSRTEVPTVVDGIRWQGEIPSENSDGDLDLWVDARGVRFLQLVNLGESSRFDWSIAEIEVDGRISR